ncbi:hypothetical protein [Citricoccus sp. GCM10030269]|uniref:hypothetical protein n=1 Tax=Citricoccus sp. GCM10030269 TaxID=3273388 RepID=UPI00361989DE
MRKLCLSIGLCVGLMAGLVGLTACSATEPIDAGQHAGQHTGQAVSELRLGLTEWSIETGGVRLSPGTVTVQVTNTGGTRHDVVIQGEEGTWASPVLGPGQRHDMTITAVAGEELELVCTLTGHDEQGMHTWIAVVED